MTFSPGTLFCLQNSFDSPRKPNDLHMFWTESDGATSDLNNAEAFTWEEALAIHKSQPAYQPIPLEYLKARSLTFVDTYLLRYYERFRLGPAARSYAHPVGAPHPEHGMFFLDATGAHTLDLAAARSYTLVETQELDPAAVTLWPADYVDERAFLHVDQTQVNVAQALGPARYAMLSELRPLA